MPRPCGWCSDAGPCVRHRPKGEPDNDALDESLAEIGREARADEACSICHASVRPDRRDRHLNWHASLSREVERERLPQVFGGRVLPPAVGRDS